jgi:hypothetical protein
MHAPPGNASSPNTVFETSRRRAGIVEKHLAYPPGQPDRQTPDEDLNHTINVWGLYNSLITFAWSRAASLVYNGERDGLGFRDSVQDILGVLTAIPEEARKRLELMLSGQRLTAARSR